MKLMENSQFQNREQEEQDPAMEQPAVNQAPVLDLDKITLEMEKPKKKRLFFRFPFNVIFAIIFLVILSGVAFGGYRVYERLTFKRTILSLLPLDTEYFARITIDKNHEQVKIADTLVHKFPGVDKLAEEIKKYLIEILRQPLDPFEPIFSLAEKEIFLAKISERNEGTLLDQLVNIIEVENPSKIAEAGETLRKSDKIKLDSYTFKGKQISHAALSELGNLQFEKFLGPAPYQLTIPFSKEAYFTDFGNFLVSADKKTDIEDMVTLVNEQSSLMKNVNSGSILEEPSFNNLVERLAKSYLFQFYQKQKAIPNVTQFPGEFGSGFIIMEGLRNLAGFTPQNLYGNFTPGSFGGMFNRDGIKQVYSGDLLQSYTASIVDNILEKVPGKSSKKKENIYDVRVGRAFTLSAQNEGVDFTTLQEQYDLSLAQFFGARKLMFNSSDSLTGKVPLKINDAEMGAWFEIENLTGQIEFAEKLLDELIKNAPDDETRTLYKRQKELIGQVFDGLLKGLFEGKGVTREDLMEVLGGRFAFYLAPKFGGEAPLGGIMLRNENIKKVEDVFSKISFEGVQSRPASDYRRQSDLNMLNSAVQNYYFERQTYPKSLEGLVPKYIDSLPKDPDTGKLYNYIVTDKGQGYWIEALLSEGTKLVATKDSYPGLPSLPKKRIEAQVAEEYNDAKIYSLSETEYLGPISVNLFWIVGGDLAVFSIGQNANGIKAIYDFYTGGNNAESLANSEQFKFENSRTPKDVLMTFYMKPYSFWGLAEYIYKLSQSSFSGGQGSKTLGEEVGGELSFVIKSYLKTMDHLFSYTSGDTSVITSSLFFRIIDLPPAEKTQAEGYIDDLLSGRVGPLAKQKVSERNNDRLTDASIWSNALSSYQFSKGHYPVFENPVKITHPFDQKGQEFINELASSGVITSSDPQTIMPWLDPMYDKGFYYEYKSLNNGSDYVLTMKMEEPASEYLCDRTISQSVCIYSIRGGNQ